MLHWAPITISSSSARSTEPYQTLVAGPRVTLPTTIAPGAIHASGWIDGISPPSAPTWVCVTPAPSGGPLASACLVPRHGGHTRAADLLPHVDLNLCGRAWRQGPARRRGRASGADSPAGAGVAGRSISPQLKTKQDTQPFRLRGGVLADKSRARRSSDEKTPFPLTWKAP